MPVLSDRSISFTAVLAGAGWIVGVALVVIDLFVAPRLDALGLIAAGAGGVLTIRGFFCTASERERNAFQLGRDSVQGEGVTPLR